MLHILIGCWDDCRVLRCSILYAIFISSTYGEERIIELCTESLLNIDVVDFFAAEVGGLIRNESRENLHC